MLAAGSSIMHLLDLDPVAFAHMQVHLNTGRLLHGAIGRQVEGCPGHACATSIASQPYSLPKNCQAVPLHAPQLCSMAACRGAV